MAGFICKQPNGLYCRFSTITDCSTHWNLTAEDYINIRMEQVREDAMCTLEHYLKPFDWVTEYFRPYNMTQEEFDKFLEETRKEPTALYKENHSDAKELTRWSIGGNYNHPEDGCFLSLYNEDNNGNETDSVSIHLTPRDIEYLYKEFERYIQKEELKR